MASVRRTVVTSAARTTSGNSGLVTIDASQAPAERLLSLHVHVTAASGTTPSLALTVTWSNDGTNFVASEVAADSFTAITATKETIKEFTIRGGFYRVEWVITGTTPSFTFAVDEFTI